MCIHKNVSAIIHPNAEKLKTGLQQWTRTKLVTRKHRHRDIWGDRQGDGRTKWENGLWEMNNQDRKSMQHWYMFSVTEPFNLYFLNCHFFRKIHLYFFDENLSVIIKKAFASAKERMWHKINF